jgi:cell division protein FtsB
LDGDIRKEEDKARQQKAAIDALRKDPKTVERLAREKLGLARTGETVIHFEEAATNAPGASPR